jgi:hypothetical protein
MRMGAPAAHVGRAPLSAEAERIWNLSPEITGTDGQALEG